MRRRDLIPILGGAAVIWPFIARAQRPAMPVIGFLRSASLANATPLVTAFRQGLSETNFVEGQNVAIEFRSAEGHNDRLPGLTAELIRLPVSVLVCNVTAALAAKAVTTRVPIVFATGTDPIEDGLITSLSHPGGNITGVSFRSDALGAKQLELLHELLPAAKTVVVLLDTNFSGAVAEIRDIQAGAHALGQKLIVLNIGSERDLDAASATMDQQRADALLSLGAAFFLSQRDRILALAARHAVPAIYGLPEDAAAGGLMSYGSSIKDAYRLVGIYAGKILNGAKPADLPVEQSTKVELVLNLKTAKALGITVPQSILVRADEVIE